MIKITCDLDISVISELTRIARERDISVELVISQAFGLYNAFNEIDKAGNVFGYLNDVEQFIPLEFIKK